MKVCFSSERNGLFKIIKEDGNDVGLVEELNNGLLSS